VTAAEPARAYDSPAERRRALAAWLAAAAVSALLLAAVEYRSRDPDSTLYAGISARMSEQPFDRWIVPEWWGYWNLRGPYHEHPIGMFVGPALLARLGYPPEQAAYAVNGLFQVLSFALIAAIGSAVVTSREARALAWLLQLLPIAFVFRIRANQEYTMLAGLLLALYATERARTRPVWTLVMLAGFAWVLFVKGVFALMVPLACGLWLLARSSGWADGRRAWPAAVAVVAMPLAGAVLALGYDAAYREATGTSFLAAYRARQVPQGALGGDSALARSAYQLVWYTGRVLWFAFPWSLFALWLTATHRRLWRPPGAAARPDARSRPQEGAWFALATSGCLLLVFSLAHRKADRYIFPVYFLAGAVGAVWAVQHSPRLDAWVQRLDRPWVPAAVWMVLFLARLATVGKLPEFTFWRT
jgi:4-amino-4-deoxy-L-arabinose transferase-like glycosyltransferase